MTQTSLYMAIIHRYMNNGGPGRGGPGFSILTANSHIMSLEMLNKNVNFAIILGYTAIWMWDLYAYKNVL
jgi:hypothetical protein